MMVKKPSKSFFIKIAAVVFWLVLWQIAAVLIDNQLALASPLKTLAALGGMIAEGHFWLKVAGSFYRIAGGFLLAIIAAIALSVPAYKVKYADAFFAPVMTVLKTVPVASFIILLLISLKSKDNLSTIICFIMSLPVIYTNTLAGISSVDPQMLEMAKIFRVSLRKKLIYLYMYKTLPFFSAGCKIALGLCWKSGVAAELIGLVKNTIGNELYYAKLYLLMDHVFAWTAVTVGLSVAFESLVLGSLDALKQRLEK